MSITSLGIEIPFGLSSVVKVEFAESFPYCGISRETVSLRVFPFSTFTENAIFAELITAATASELPACVKSAGRTILISKSPSNVGLPLKVVSLTPLYLTFAETDVLLS